MRTNKKLCEDMLKATYNDLCNNHNVRRFWNYVYIKDGTYCDGGYEVARESHYSYESFINMVRDVVKKQGNIELLSKKYPKTFGFKADFVRYFKGNCIKRIWSKIKKLATYFFVE